MSQPRLESERQVSLSYKVLLELKRWLSNCKQALHCNLDPGTAMRTERTDSWDSDDGED